MRKILIGLIASVLSVAAMGQSCVPGGGITCTTTLDMYIIPQHYPRYDIPINDNTQTIDAFAATAVTKTNASPQTLAGQLIVPSLIDVELGSTTAPVCPNGTGGALTTIGCSAVANGFPFMLGNTSVAASSTTTAIDGLTLTTTSVNGVTLNALGSTSLFLNQAGGYTAPAVTGGTVTQVNTGAGLTGGPVTGVGTISIDTAGVTNAMLVNSSTTVNGSTCSLGGSCSPIPSNISGGSVGAFVLQSAANTTVFLASPTTSGHAYVPMWQPMGVALAPTVVDLGTFLGSNITASSPIVATPSTLGTQLSCPTCGTAGGGTSVGVNGGGTLGSMNINAVAPVADANYVALLPKISAANLIIEAPYGSASVFGVFEVDNVTVTATAGVLSSSSGLSGMTATQLAVAGSATTITSSISVGNTGTSIPRLSGGLLNAAIIPNNAANTSGTAANLSGTPTLPNGAAAITQSLGDASTKIATDAFVIANAGSLSGMTATQVAIAGSANSITSSIALGNSGSNIPQLSGGLLAASVIPNNAANTTGNAAALAGGLNGSAPYQSAVNTTAYIPGPTTSGHAFFYGWQPSGSLIAPTAVDLGTFIGTNVTASSPIVATPSTLGTNLSCPTCGSSSGGTAVGVNGGGSLASLNINAISPVADANFLALTPKISGADMIIEAPFGSASVFGVVKCGTGTSCASGVISTASLSFTNLLSGSNSTANMIVTSGASLGASGTGTIAATSAPYSGLTGTVPIWNQNTTGTAANLSGTPALPNGTTATTQALGNNTTNLATTAFVIANSVQGICKGTITLPTAAIANGAYALVAPVTCAGLLTTDDLHLIFNGTPLSTVGYMPSTTGAVLTIYYWITAGNINVAIGNSTGATQTPAAASVVYHAMRF